MRRAAVIMLAAASVGAAPALPRYSDVPLTPIADGLVIGGERYAVAYFTTGDSVAGVAAHLQAGWRGEGYPVTLVGDFVEHGVVSAFDTREGWVRSIALRRHAGKTLGFSVLKALWQPPPTGRDQLPPLEGALHMSRSEAPASQHRASVMADALTRTRALRHAEWVKAGWRLVRELGGRGQQTLEYARGKDQATVTLVEVDAATTAVAEMWLGGRGR